MSSSKLLLTLESKRALHKDLKWLNLGTDRRIYFTTVNILYWNVRHIEVEYYI